MCYARLTDLRDRSIALRYRWIALLRDNRPIAHAPDLVDKMRSRSDLRGGMPLVTFNHVIDPHVATFSSSIQHPQPTVGLTLQ